MVKGVVTFWSWVWSKGVVKRVVEGCGRGRMLGHGCGQRAWSRVWSHFGHGCGQRVWSLAVIKGVVKGRGQRVWSRAWSHFGHRVKHVAIGCGQRVLSNAVDKG